MSGENDIDAILEALDTAHAEEEEDPIELWAMTGDVTLRPTLTTVEECEATLASLGALFDEVGFDPGSVGEEDEIDDPVLSRMVELHTEAVTVQRKLVLPDQLFDFVLRRGPAPTLQNGDSSTLSLVMGEIFGSKDKPGVTLDDNQRQRMDFLQATLYKLLADEFPPEEDPTEDDDMLDELYEEEHPALPDRDIGEEYDVTRWGLTEAGEAGWATQDDPYADDEYGLEEEDEELY